MTTDGSTSQPGTNAPPPAAPVMPPMHPSLHAQTRPDHPAIIDAETGAITTYAALDAASNRAAHLFRERGLQIGDTVAFMLDNTPEFYALAWGAQRSGLFYVCISTKLTAPEVDYIIADSGARLLVASGSLADVVATLDNPVPRLSLGGAIADTPAWEDETAAMPATSIADQRAGVDMLYSSGTTGRPKGVRVALPPDGDFTAAGGLAPVSMALGLNGETVYLSPAPLYHAAPLRWSMAIHRLGGTVVLMRKFEPEAALAAIERFRCTASQWVPTHFIRMLKLPDTTRAHYDVSSMRCAIHAAAPCPIPVKRAMIDWWGPVIIEYYAGSEGNGLTLVNSTDWLAHPGTVGKSMTALVHICDDDGNELDPREEGTIWFEGGAEFAYHNDPEKTAASRNDRGWSTLGDVGWVDEEGFLYLTDRKSFMIISGGVNIYPQEIENHLAVHPKVMDVAVVGAPHEDMGEQVVAVVQPVAGVARDDALRDELLAWCRGTLSGVKIPRRIDFTDELPRHPTGKLYKRLIRDRYWGKESRIV